MTRLWRTAVGVACAAAVLAGGAAPTAAQGVEESRLLRDAASREARGDFDGAEAVLRRILEANPASSGGLFALERVLRAKGEPRGVLPAADAYLARDGSASGVRHLKLRILVEVDSLPAAQEEAERWLQAQPTSETAYREVAGLFERAFGPARALAVLERGRRATGDPGALALEMGDLKAVMGQRQGALEEWAQAVGVDGAQAAAVSRRVAGLSDDPRGAARALVAILGAAPQAGRRRAGVQIALDLRLGDEALALARRTVGTLEDRQKAAFLADVARRARDADLGDVASWAYAELGQDAASPAERRQFDQRLVEISLAAGDTLAALEAQRRVVASFTPGSVDHRRASAEELRLQGAVVPPEDARAGLDDFRARFPDAPELDGLAADVAGALMARGDAEGAEAVLEGMGGPRSSLQRGYLLLDAGRIDEARSSFLLALPGLEPSSATEIIQLVSLVGRLSPQSGEVLARAGSLAHRGRGAEAAEAVAASLDALDEAERAPLLAEAARLAETSGGADAAADLRARLLREHPDSPEAAEASLALARYHASRPDGRGEAIRLLEELVVRSPDAPMVPDARRELERLRRSR